MSTTGMRIAEQRVVAAMLGNNAPGAFTCGTRVRKVNNEPADIHPPGTLGTVVGSMATVDPSGVRHGYLVRWDHLPNALGFVIDRKLQRA